MKTVNLLARRFAVYVAIIAILPVIVLTTAASAQPTVEVGADASGGCNQAFLTFPAWYRGIVTAECEVISPSEHPGKISGFIWTIGLNIVEILLHAAGYAAVGFIIYGGYKYMISAGSPDGMVSARKTIMNAVIGLVISVGAIAIVRTIVGGIGIGA